MYTTWDGLASGETYTFTVTCQLQGEDCEGDPVTFTASTKSCSGQLAFLTVISVVSDFIVQKIVQILQSTIFC